MCYMNLGLLFFILALDCERGDNGTELAKAEEASRKGKVVAVSSFVVFGVVAIDIATLFERSSLLSTQKRRKRRE